MHRGLAGSDATLASVGPLSEGFERLLPRRSNLVAYVRWTHGLIDFPPVRQSFQQLSGRTPRIPFLRTWQPLQQPAGALRSMVICSRGVVNLRAHLC